jgi:hypothetical protein
MILYLCSKCFETIEEIEESELWVTLCKMYHQNGILSIQEHKIPYRINQLRSLEKNGFINTLDNKDSVFIKVNGFDDEFDTFCIKRNEHYH